MIIDTHTHFYDPSRPQGVPWPPADNKLLYRTVLPHHYKALAEPEGVTGTVVVEASKWLEDNAWVLDMAAQEPFIVGLVGHIDPAREGFSKDLARFAANPLLRGIRCGGGSMPGGGYFAEPGTGRFLADMELLAEKDLELDAIFRAEHVDGLVGVAKSIPELRIVVNHIAHMPIDGNALTREWVDYYGRMAEQPGIYMKVSGLMENSVVQPAPSRVDFYRPLLDVLWDSFGEDRLVFGSNWPVCERAGSFPDSIRIVRAYFGEKDDEGAESADKFFWRNSQAAYKWVQR